MFKKVTMKIEINETYIANLSTYMHLLSNNEIIEEIKKPKAYINHIRIDGYHERNKINTLKIAIDTINKLSNISFKKHDITGVF